MNNEDNIVNETKILVTFNNPDNTVDKELTISETKNLMQVLLENQDGTVFIDNDVFLEFQEITTELLKTAHEIIIAQFLLGA